MTKKGTKQKIQPCTTLSENQQGIFFETIRSSHAVYISQMCLILRGTFHWSLLKDAYYHLIKRHEILRSAFDIDPSTSTPVQLIYENVVPIISYHDYTKSKPTKKDEYYQQFLEADRATTFDLSQPSLMRLAILQMSKTEHHIVWTRHHILLDGSSVMLLLTELFTLYDALLNNKVWNLPSPCSYFHIKEKFNLCLPKETASYWKQRLKFFSESSFLPSTSTSKPSKIKRFERLNSVVSCDDFSALSQFATQHDLTINSVLQAAWAIVLSHYSNNQHIIFGSVRAYPKEEVKNCAGLFINTLPLAFEVDPNIKILNFLTAVREQGKKLRKYVHTSLSDLRKWCELPLDKPLYQSIIDYKPYSINKIINSKLKNIDCKISLHLETPYPLALELGNEIDHLTIQLNYSSDLLTPQCAKEMVHHFQDIIKEVCLYPNKTLSELSTLTQEDRLKSVIDWNNTQKVYPLNKTLHQYFEEQVKQTPNAIAVSYKDKNLTYELLNQQANQLAHFMITKGIQPESLIVILTEPTINSLVALLAVLKTGAAYVPIDIKSPVERIKYIINDSNTQIVICDKKTEHGVAKALEQISNPISLINLDAIPLHRFPASNPERCINASNLAYMIYTSGSTGAPKGALVEHKPVLNMALGCIERLKVTSESRLLQIASFGFDVAVAEWCVALLSGARLYYMDKEIFNPLALMDTLEFYKISTIILASSILAALPQRRLPDLKVIAVGGESCSDAIINFWAKNRLFLNVYGITEAAVCSTMGNCCPEQKILSIGHPLPNTQIYILNDLYQPLPIGVSGEIYIGGLGVARGYWNKADLTNEKFIKNPLVHHHSLDESLQGDRLYRTGDKGRWLPNGELEFLGRVDDQVKIMGIRIELLEIEQTIEQYPSIEKSAVILTSNKQLHAFILTYEHDMDLEKLRQFLSNTLPHSLIPHHFIMIDELPLTANGKTNKAQLANYHPIKKPTSIHHEKRTHTENVIFSAIQGIIGVNNFSINQNYLELGLKSIELVELSVKLSTLFNQEVSVVLLFEHSTIKILADYIDSLRFNRDEEELSLKKHIAFSKRQLKFNRVNFEK